MKVADIRDQLHVQIDQIQDEVFLLELSELVKLQLVHPIPYELNEAQLQAIEEGRAQHRAGLGIPHEQVMEEIDSWLKDK